MSEQPFVYSTFETEHRVRPDDIDMFQHVHNSRYFDYVLAARYEQMDTCYGMAMEKFMERGFGWVVRTAHVDKGCRVAFTLTNKATKKVCCDGYFDYVMIDMKTGRSAKIPDDVIEHYRI
jgi:acyl-CoA thioesterase FadM